MGFGLIQKDPASLKRTGFPHLSGQAGTSCTLLAVGERLTLASIGDLIPTARD